MSTPTSGDLLLVNRGGVNYQIDYDDMSTLQDNDLLLVNRAGVNYQIAASDLDLGPDGLIVPSVDVLTPVNGAGLDEGTAYTPFSSAYVSTDSTPVRYRYFPELIETISGGPWVDENNLFDGSGAIHAELTGAADSVSQFVFTPHSGWIEGETDCYVYGTAGGTIEILDDAGTVLRTYSYLSTPGDYAVGIVRSDQKIRFTSNGVNESIYVAAIGGSDGGAVDYVIPGRVAFEFTDDTDLDKMVAPIIMTDENGNVKVPTTSTVDSTTTIPGENKSLHAKWVGDGTTRTFTAGSGTDNTPSGDRMVFVKENNSRPGLILDNDLGGYLYTSNTNGKANFWSPIIDENQSDYRTNNGQINNSGKTNYVTEIGVAPKVLDIVKWQGNDTNNREIPHNLGTKPGMIIVKSYDSTYNWSVWHHKLYANSHLQLHEQFSQTILSGSYFPSEPTKDNFYIGDSAQVNHRDYNYVAYVFAADTPGKVMCDKYYGGIGGQQTLNVGFQAGFVLIKRLDGSTDWIATNKEAAADYKYWNPNREDNVFQGNSGDYISFGATSITLNGDNTDFNANGSQYVYLAIADDLNGPNSTQLNLLGNQDLEYFTDGTAITSNLAASGSNISFGSYTWSGIGQDHYFRKPELAGDDSWYDIRPRTGKKWLTWIKNTTSSASHHLFDSERNGYQPIYTDYSQAEAYSSQGYLYPVDSSAGFRTGPGVGINRAGDTYVSWNFLAAPQFFDVQKFVGNGASQSISHDLGVEPGFIIVKSLNTSDDFYCYHHTLGFNNAIKLNKNYAANSYSGTFTGASASDFTVGVYNNELNAANNDYIAYIFAKETPYVKCGSYVATGGGTSVTGLGFRPRWVMIKCTTGSSTDWVVLDPAFFANSEFIRLNTSADKGNITSWSFDTDGFTVTDTSPSFSNGGDTYLYVAIADWPEGHPPSAPSSATVQGTPDVNAATMVVNAESFDVGDTASAAALEASITSLAGTEGNTLLVDGSTGTWMPGLYAKGSETTASAPSADEIVFTSSNAGTTPFTGVDATLASRTWTLESSSSATGPWTVVDTYVDYDVLASQDGATPWTSNKPALAADTFYRVKVQYNSTNAESVESVYSTFKTSA